MNSEFFNVEGLSREKIEELAFESGFVNGAQVRSKPLIL